MPLYVENELFFAQACLRELCLDTGLGVQLELTGACSGLRLCPVDRQ